MNGNYRRACPDSAVAHIGTAHQNESPRGAQPSQSDRDESADRGFGRQTASCCEGVEAVARKFVRRDISPEIAGLCALGQQVSDDVCEVLLRLGDMLTSMQECREFGSLPLASVASLVSDLGKIFEVASDGPDSVW